MAGYGLYHVFDVIRSYLPTNYTALASSSPVIDDKPENADMNADLEASPDQVVDAFVKITSDDGRPHGLPAYAKADKALEQSWFKALIPGIEKFANSYHLGNYVATARGAAPLKEFEPMPIYARLGMHILFYGRAQNHLLHTKKIEQLFKDQSIKQGKLYDSTEGALAHIQQFVKDYDLSSTLSQLEKPNLKDYKTFNEFFTRAIKAEARPIDGQNDRAIIVSAADCRLTVFESVSQARKFWIKDKTFTVKSLLKDHAIVAQLGDEPSVAIFRLAPADYHRWHAPVEGKASAVTHCAGSYYTVNPQAVNQDFTVFTANKRDIVTMSWPAKDAKNPDIPVVIVAVGALLVGAIQWLQTEGQHVKKGAPQGYFAYGGSTVIALFPKGTVKWDDDLLRNSEAALETKVSVGNHIGVAL